MSVLTRKLLRDLRATRGQVIAVVSIITVGVMCYVGMLQTYENLDLAKHSYYTQCRMADFWVSLKKTPASEIAALSDLPGVAEVRSRISFPITFDLPDVARPLTGRVISMPDRRRSVINDFVLKRGGYFTESRRNEVILSDEFARLRKLRPGDRIHLLLNNQRKEMVIVGTADSSEFTYLLSPGGLVPEPAHYCVFYVKRTFAEEVFDFEGAANEAIGRIQPERAERPGAVLQAIERRLDPFGVATTTALGLQESNFMLTNEILQGEKMATLLATIFLFVAALVLNVLMTRMAQQQRTVIGTLRALGYTRRQILIHFLGFGVSVGAAGAALGCLLGYLLAGAMTHMYGHYYSFPRLENHIDPVIFAGGAAMSLLFAVLGTVRGVRAVGRLRPAEAMRPRPPASGKQILLERFHLLWSRFGFQTHMVLRDMFRNRLRSAADLCAAALGSAIMLTAFYYRDSFIYLIDFQYDLVDRSDYTLVFKDTLDEGAVDACRDLPGVTRAEPMFHLGCTMVNGRFRKKTAVMGLSPEAQLTVPRDARGKRVRLPESGVLLDEKLAEILRAAPGDVLTLIPTSGLRRPLHVPVASVSKGYLGLTAYANLEYLQRLVDEESAVSSVQLQVDRSPAIRYVLYRRLKELPRLEHVAFVRDMKQSLSGELLAAMNVTILFLVGFASVIFFGSILNSALIALAERGREVATLRVLGYTNAEVGGIFLRENLILNMLGTILGLPLGYALCVASVWAFSSELFRLPLVIRPISWILTFVLALAFSLIAHQVVRRSIRRLDWLDALQAKE